MPPELALKLTNPADSIGMRIQRAITNVMAYPCVTMTWFGWLLETASSTALNTLVTNSRFVSAPSILASRHSLEETMDHQAVQCAWTDVRSPPMVDPTPHMMLSSSRLSQSQHL